MAFDTSATRLEQRVAEMRPKRGTRKALGRLTRSAIKVSDADIPVMATGAELLVYPILGIVRAVTRRRVSRRFPDMKSRGGLLAGYALPGETQLHPWPGRVARRDDGVWFDAPRTQVRVDLSDATFVTYCDGVAWIEARRDGKHLVTLAIYAEAALITELLPDVEITA